MDKYNVGDVVFGIVTGIKPYGAFVSVGDEFTGLVHISEISDGFVKNIEDFMHMNEKINLKIIEIDQETKHMKLSLKSLTESKRSNQRKYMQFSKDYRKDISNYKKDYGVVEEIVNASLNKKNQENTVTTNLEYVAPIVVDNYAEQVKDIHKLLHNQDLAKTNQSGWVNLPNLIDEKELEQINRYANDIRTRYNTFVICGIGGSYLGARAGIEMLSGIKKDNKIEIVYIGFTLSSHYNNQVIDFLKGRDFIVNVISKSGTTLESSIGFRLLRNLLIQKYGQEMADTRIIVTTDADSGLLRKAANDKKYISLTIPQDIGGRYSVLTSVGLLPFAVAGIDIIELMKGAKKAYLDLSQDEVSQNESYRYAVARLEQQKQGKNIEILVAYEPQLMYFGEWWKQLFGESEGKDKKGIFPAFVNYSTDLHSLGQFIQDGTPIVFETVLNLMPNTKEIVIHANEDDFDQLNYLKNQTLSRINQMILQSSIAAHHHGSQVPNIVLNVNRYDAFGLGYLFYFFMKSCAMASYLLGVNPFNQPGVEVYKQNLFGLLGKK